jgi:hypothetical protein
MCYLLDREGGTRQPRLMLHNEAKYEGLQGLAQLPRTCLLGTWVNKGQGEGRSVVPRPTRTKSRRSKVTDPSYSKCRVVDLSGYDPPPCEGERRILYLCRGC